MTITANDCSPPFVSISPKPALVLVAAMSANCSSHSLGHTESPRVCWRPSTYVGMFRAPTPNLLWASDFTYVLTWQGFVDVAFVVDIFADHIVGWRVSRSAKTDFVFDALDQALHDQRPVEKSGLVHQSDRPSRDIAAQCPAGQWAGNIYSFAIPSVWPKQALNHRSAASGIPATTRSLKRSMVSTKPN
ncbi:Integrase core domain-containing protein [Monaibacterium marinum]|uniref:Integrase core domain-containing protein n=1 Tax=Pontivivens marinum TaxID=1690039 RepID=A0A2C9CVX5_9RHOB|nr:Integrase core domain-containing protein [Monaibacterium marinum]